MARCIKLCVSVFFGLFFELKEDLCFLCSHLGCPFWKGIKGFCPPYNFVVVSWCGGGDVDTRVFGNVATHVENGGGKIVG